MKRRRHRWGAARAPYPRFRQWMREKTSPVKQQAEQCGRSSGLVVVPVCVSGVKCETTRNVTSYNFGTAASNGLSSGMSSGGGKMRRERGLHYLSRCVQEKQGIISRATETVKSIVPAWLQKYFNKRENECAAANKSANQAATPVNQHHNYADGGTLNDGRYMPERATLNRQEPSTSSSALSYPVALTRPALHRSHLNYTMSDSSVPPSQPSTSSIFGIGSPRLSFIKEIKDSTSQQDDDNMSTTSGFSSRASDKDVGVLKNTSSSLLWTTEADRTHSLSQHSAASSKKPAFSLSAFGGMCAARGSTSDCKKNQPGYSPYYPGKTAYGGAAGKSKPLMIEPYRVQMRRRVRQEKVQSHATLSTAARCILEAMEKLSSPLMDAKKMLPLLPLSSPPDIDELNIPDLQPKRRKLDSQNESPHPPVKRLVKPRLNLHSMRQVQYSKPAKTSTPDSSKICNGVDTKYQWMREKTSPVKQQAEQCGRSSGLVVVPVCVSGVKCETTRNVTSYNFGTAASNGLSSGMSSGGGEMRRERGLHYLSRSVQEQWMREKTSPVKQQAEQCGRSSGLVVVPVCVSGVKCETTRNVTSYNFGTAASNGLSSGMSSGGGEMRKERGLHYLSRSVQEQWMREKTSPVKQQAEQCGRSSGLVVVPVCVSGVKCETTRNVTSYNFGTAASNGLSSGMSSGGGEMRKERGLHYLSRSVQEQIQPTSNASNENANTGPQTVKSAEAEVLSTFPIGFTFSVPVVKSSELSGSGDTPVMSFLTLETSSSSSTNNEQEEKQGFVAVPFRVPFKYGRGLKEGSVLDILKNPGEIINSF
ncbi:nuclear pore complex protein Nup153-like isoform X1 [Anas acuta]|uniref:nuclear pore complex protein Nup153-like isoform X1 n=3 Tax=Anas acuta TaxID=28680 RepID=UPI0035C882B7